MYDPWPHASAEVVGAASASHLLPMRAYAPLLPQPTLPGVPLGGGAPTSPPPTFSSQQALADARIRALSLASNMAAAVSGGASPAVVALWQQQMQSLVYDLSQIASG